MGTLIPWAEDVDLIHVVCRVGTVGADTVADIDRKPDFLTSDGTVSISSLVPGGLIEYAEEDGRSRLVNVATEEYSIDLNTGELVDASGNVGCYVLSPASDRVKPQGYGYKAVITFGEAGSVTVLFNETPTQPDGSIDLAKLVIEPVPDGTTPTTVAQALANMQAQIDGVALGIGDAVADYLTANPPAAAPDATPTVTGLVRLAGDLGGTALAPTVPGLAGKAAIGHTHTLDLTTDTATRLALTPAERTKLNATSGTNSGDQTLPTWTSLSGRPAVIAAGVDAAAARAAIGAGTSSLVVGTGTTDAKAGNYSPPAATATAQGIVELATPAEALTGTDTARAVTPAGVKAVADTLLTTAAAPELIRDTMGAALVAGANVTITPNDAGDTITVAAAAGGGGGGVQEINAKTGTTYTLVAGDAGKLVTCTNAAAITVTVPAATFTAGQRVDVAVLGTGMVTVVGGSGMTVEPEVGQTLVSRARRAVLAIRFLSPSVAVVEDGTAQAGPTIVYGWKESGTTEGSAPDLPDRVSAKFRNGLCIIHLDVKRDAASGLVANLGAGALPPPPALVEIQLGAGSMWIDGGSTAVNSAGLTVGQRYIVDFTYMY